MPSITAITTNWTAGEVSPRLYGRIDLEKYGAGAHKIENFIVQRFGGIRKRGGTEHINETKTSSTRTRLIPFIYSVTQAYILEFGDEYIRFYANGGVVESGGSAVEISSPYGEDELSLIQYAQSADVLYLSHPNYKPRKLERTDATTFTLTELEFEDGPYLELNSSSTTMTPADYAMVTPTMTGLTAPSGTVSSSTSSTTAWNIFDKDESTDGIFTGTTGWVQYRLASSATKVVDGYFLKATASVNNELTPTSWRFYGSNNGSTWILLDAQNDETGWAQSETRFYSFVNETAYEYFRFQWTGTGSDFAQTRIGELGIHLAPVSQTAFNLTASSTDGINNDTGFQSTDVDRHIRLLGADGKWRWAKISAYTSSTVVTVKLYEQALLTLEPIQNWQFGAWSDETGWPASVGFYEGRLCFARTAEQPESIWMSRVDDFLDHGVSDPVVADDAISLTIRSDSLNEVKWIAESADMFVGTSAAIRVVGSATNSEVFSPTNIKQRRETTFGASAVRPVLVGNVGLYADYYGTSIREFAYSFELNGYVSQDMSILAEHLLTGGVKEMAYAQNPDAVLWVVETDGNLRALTYERDQNVVAFHRQTLGGTDVTVESVASIPGTSNDEVWLIVKRTINGGTKRYVERLSVGLSDSGDLDDATFLDSHLVYSGSSTTSLTGLDHLEGESVYVWSDAGKQGPYTVSSGSITVGSAVTVACVGLAYTSLLETLSPEVGARGGTAQTRLGHTSEVFLRLDRSMGGTIGPSEGAQETLDYTTSTDIDANYGTGTALFTGDVRVPIAGGWNRYKRLKLVHSDPVPFHCIAMVSEHRVTG